MLSRDAIDACYVALLTGLWADMEAIVGLHYTEDAFGPGAPERVGLRVEALLQEIDLLRSRSESAPIVRAQSRLFDELRRAECYARPQHTIPELPRVHPAERASQA